MLMRGGRMDSKTPSTTHLTETELIDRLRLIRSDNVGPRGIMAQTPQALRPVRSHLMPFILERNERCVAYVGRLGSLFYSLHTPMV
jgi:hypothetical protein